ncbi:MAG: DNA polymerase III subunit beta [Eubacteriales bacterium]|nr:DNA polymerase III subunit beta [Eubacteriales bacterium]
MKLKISRNSLLNGIQIVSKAVPSKTTMSILQCILIDASADRIKLIANDMELGIQTTIDGQILERGIIAVDSSIFSSIIRKLPDNTVSITTEGEKISIVCEKAKFNILGKNGNDFCYLPEIERLEGISVSQFTLRDIITKTIFSISDNESNKLMTGELMEIRDGILKLVSLDGHRISIRKVELNGSYNDRKVVIPGKTLSEVSKILSGDMDKTVSIFFTGKHVLFEFDDTIVVSRLIEGEYFRIEQMLSSDYETKMTINRQEILSCIDRATLLVKEGDKKPIIIAISEGMMELKINTTVGSMDETIEINKAGKDLMIGFNPKFLIDALRAIDDEEVDMYFVNPKAPCFIRNNAEDYIYLILPVNFTTVD